MKKLKPKAKTVKNKKFSDPEWYVSIAADILDLNFASLAKDLSQSLKPEITDTAKELLEIYEIAFNNSLKSLKIDKYIKCKNGSEALFFNHIIDPNFPSYHPLFFQLIKSVSLSIKRKEITISEDAWLSARNTLRQDFSGNFSTLSITV